MDGLLIGRFQPFHKGHLEAVHIALSKVDNLWVGIGSSNKSHEKRNPFTADERKEMILSSLDSKTLERVKIFFVPDTGDHERWTNQVDSLLRRHKIYGINSRELISSGKDWSDLVPEGNMQVLLKIVAKSRLAKIL